MIERLKKRSDFLHIASQGNSWFAPTVITQILPRQDQSALVRVGVTASKKAVGGAVLRNRAKRRLRALAQDFMKEERLPLGHDLVLIARKDTVDCPWDKLVADFRWSLKRLLSEQKS